MGDPIKLPHERLRNGEIHMPDNTYIKPEEFNKFCKSLADSIEKYYVPRPRFEDGTVVECGSITETGVIKYGIIRLDGSYSVCDKHGKVLAEGHVDEFVRCPPPELWDSDGTVINEGDIVWNLDVPGRCGKVAYIEHNREDENKSIVYCESEKEGCFFTERPGNLTHEEPDDLVKLLYDINRVKKSVAYRGTEIDTEIDDWTNRISDMIERNKKYGNRS